MKDCVLFSPLGMSDPSRGNFDGAFLHILRHYKPSKAYLFLTNEINNNDIADNRYEIMAKKLLPKCEIIKLPHPDIIKANDFAIYDEPFRSALRKVKAENPDSEIIVNITSGTTQMAATLYLLAAVMNFPINLIQVDTPQNAANRGKLNSVGYDCEDEWKNLIDNDDNCLEELMVEKNRTRNVTPNNVTRMILLENIASHINKYEYHAAHELMKTAEELFSEEFRYFLSAACDRINLSLKSARKKLAKANINEKDIFIVESSDEINIYEYILYLQIKLQKNELADFARGGSPVIVDLFENILKRKAKIPLKDYITVKNDISILDKEKLSRDMLEKLNDTYSNVYRSVPVATSNLMVIIEWAVEISRIDESLLKKCQTLRAFDEKIRNRAAHEIIAIQERWSDKLNEKPEDILNNIKFLYRQAFSRNEKNIWGSYDDMNVKLLSYMK